MASLASPALRKGRTRQTPEQSFDTRRSQLHLLHNGTGSDDD